MFRGEAPLKSTLSVRTYTVKGSNLCRAKFYKKVLILFVYTIMRGNVRVNRVLNTLSIVYEKEVGPFFWRTTCTVYSVQGWDVDSDLEVRKNEMENF